MVTVPHKKTHTQTPNAKQTQRTVQQLVHQREGVPNGVFVKVVAKVTLENVHKGKQELEHQRCDVENTRTQSRCTSARHDKTPQNTARHATTRHATPGRYAQGLAFERVTATRNMFLCRVYRNVEPSICWMGG